MVFVFVTRGGRENPEAATCGVRFEGHVLDNHEEL